MNDRDLYTLANYNSEVERGLVHTGEWKEKMAQLQTWYDAEWEASIGLVRLFKSYPTPSAVLSTLIFGSAE